MPVAAYAGGSGISLGFRLGSRSMAFPPAFLDELRQRLACSEVIAKRVRLIKKGREYAGLCPFHSEKTPSFKIGRASCRERV